MPALTQALCRSRQAKRQLDLTAEQRRLNVRRAFQIPNQELPNIHNKHVLLIDDVITTGATVEACSRALLRAGAANVDVLAVALVSEPLSVTT